MMSVKYATLVHFQVVNFVSKYLSYLGTFNKKQHKVKTSCHAAKEQLKEMVTSERCIKTHGYVRLKNNEYTSTHTLLSMLISQI